MLVCGWGGGGASYHVSSFSCLRLLLPCSLVYVCVFVRGPSLWRPPSILNIFICHTIVSPWFVAIPHSERVCVFAGGAGWGFIPCFSLLLSPSSCTLRSCVCVCMCAWSVPLAPSFAFLTYLLAIPLFPRGSWASPFALFFFVVYLAVLGAYGGILGIYGCGSCLWACLITCVVVCGFFLCAALSLGRPPSQHTWLSHLRMCSGGYDM